MDKLLDLLDAVDFLRKEKVLNKFPTYVAKDLSKIPTDEVMCISRIIDEKLSQIQQRISLEVTNMLSVINLKIEQLEARILVEPKNPVLYQDVQPPMAIGDNHNIPTPNLNKTGPLTWAEVCASSALVQDNSGTFPLYRTVSTAPCGSLDPPVVRRVPSSFVREGGIIGSGDNIKDFQAARPFERKSVVYVGNVDASVENDKVSEFISSKGIDVISLVRLQPGRRQQENPPPQGSKEDSSTGLRQLQAAFRLVIKEKHLPSILNSSFWPCNITVRKWIFNPRPPPGLQQNNQSDNNGSQ